MHYQLYIYRGENHLRQIDMAEILHIILITYQLKESENAVFTFPEAKTSAKYFNTTLDELFGD